MKQNVQDRGQEGDEIKEDDTPLACADDYGGGLPLLFTRSPVG